MDIKKAIGEIYLGASVPRIFTLDEIINLPEFGLDHEAIVKLIHKDPRFISFQLDDLGTTLFITDSILFNWFINLNFRLAKLRIYELSSKHVGSLLCQLRNERILGSLPSGCFRWGQKLGLISASRNRDKYFFPVAKAISLIRRKMLLEMVKGIFTDFKEKRIWRFSLKKRMNASLKEGFSIFGDQIAYIVKKREGLGEGRATLQALGDHFKLTRERIRQREESFWNSIHYGYKNIRPFLEAFLCDLMSHSGGLIFDDNSSEASLRKFLAKCLEIPQLDLPVLGLTVLAPKFEERNYFKAGSLFPAEVDEKLLADILVSRYKFDYSKKDIQHLARKIGLFWHKWADLSQRARICLQFIGRPAHYSEIASVHNSIWPEKKIADHNIHASLSRQQEGIVWIGIRGTFALKEWGYEKPSMTLFHTVAEIVKEKHRQLRRPVPSSIIVAELGRYRKLVKQSSLTIAIGCNPDLIRVGKGAYIPRSDNKVDNNKAVTDELDIVFRDFKKTLCLRKKKSA